MSNIFAYFCERQLTSEALCMLTPGVAINTCTVVLLVVLYQLLEEQLQC